jgi:hypothetical protein
MTPFEQWCETETGRDAIRFAQGPNSSDVFAQECLAKAWNAAIDAVLKTDAILNASSAQVEEVEQLKIA